MWPSRSCSAETGLYFLEKPYDNMGGVRIGPVCSFTGMKPPCSMFWNGSPHLNCSSLDIMELKTLKGLALHDILTEVHLFVHRGNLGWLQTVRSVLSRNRKRVTDL